MWLRKGDGDPLLVPDSMPDTIKRCLGDGWAECPDPRQSPQVSPELAPEPEPQAQPLPADVAEKLERERIAAIHANNDAARAAFADMGMGPKPKPTSKGRRT